MTATRIVQPTSLAPTALGQPAWAPVPTTPVPAVANLPALSLPQNFPLPLTPEQQARLQERIEAFSFTDLSLQGITQLGFESEMGLNRVLDGFLSRIDKQSTPQLFQLVSTLNERVEAEKLPEVADRILNAKPSLMVRMLGMVYPKALKQAAARAFEEVVRVASGKSKALSDLVAKMEQTLRQEMNTLNDELRHMDTVKAAYRESFVSFAEDTAFLHNALAKAQAQFAAIEPELANDQQRRQDALDKLQALESRALAVEGAMTKLPADQLVIRQLQNAGVATLQELATTMAARFASIKMTLLTIHGALMVQNVQRLGQQGADLDANLSKVRGKLMKDVVQTAAHAPGKNREQQANQLKEVVAESQALVALVEEAKASNQQKFTEARATMAQARQDMLQLGKTLNPSATVGARTY